MKISESHYKNIFAVRLETEKYVAFVLPSEGGKIASFVDKKRGKEYLIQNPSPQYLHIGFEDDFEKGECSGFDDMFPTIDFAVVNGKEYPDHGEVCRVAFSYVIQEDKLVLNYFSSKIGYSYQKVLTEGKNGELRVAYEITNQSGAPLDALWAAHCLLKVEQGGRILVPFENGDLIDCVYDSNQTINESVSFSYSEAHLVTRWTEKQEAKKLYFPEKCKNGIVGYEYPAGDIFVIEFDKDKLPYLGLWIDYGFVNGSYYIGLEPCSLGYDTVAGAAQRNQIRKIQKNERLKFDIALYIR